MTVEHCGMLTCMPADIIHNTLASAVVRHKQIMQNVCFIQA